MIYYDILTDFIFKQILFQNSLQKGKLGFTGVEEVHTDTLSKVLDCKGTRR